DYIDSSGLATLVEILKSLNKQGGKLKLTNLSVKVKGLFEITKLTQLFDILDKEDEAINSFDKQK
ncbi:MAG: STAS domain-containing protein, partial [Candidatus Omnitrophica bacterium]|nr:STAS domain-containing protein [Candidatus Omnitrophota bacterium]